MRSTCVKLTGYKILLTLTPVCVAGCAHRVLYPLFICRMCSVKLFARVIGLLYSLVFASFQWYGFSCNIANGRPYEGIYNLSPALCVSFCCFWYAFQVARTLLRGQSKRWTIWGKYDHRSLVRVLFVPPEQNEATNQDDRSTLAKVWYRGNILPFRVSILYTSKSPFAPGYAPH